MFPAGLVRQAPLKRAKDRLDAALRRERVRGLVGAHMNDAGTVMTNYWHGEVPDRVRGLMSRLQRDEQIGLPVVTLPHSARDLEAESRRLLSLPKRVTGANIIAAGPLRDFSGIRVVIEGSQQHGRLRVQSAYKLVTRQDRYPLPAVSSRWYDFPEPDYHGGAMMWSPEASAYCSNAFAVRTRYGREGMLSAHHCLNGGSWATWSTPYDGH